MLNTSFSPWPSFSQEEIDATSKILASGKVNYWTGCECIEFEKEFATWCGVKHAVALSNGTVALEVALRALNIGPGDEVIVTPRTFIASASSIVNVGASPVFADVDPNSGNISSCTISKVLSPNTKAVICVHLAGWPCDMDSIMTQAQEHNFFVIEDCAQAHGATYKGQSVGSIGHIGAWSFCQDKIMTTGGEGGMVTTNDETLFHHMWSYKDHGKSYDAVYNRKHPAGFRWLNESFGTNFRMTEMQAAIGRIQIHKMEDWHKKRKENASAIYNACENFPSILRVPSLPSFVEHAWYKCYVYIQQEVAENGKLRDTIIKEMNRRDIPCYSGTCSEVYLEKAFNHTEFRPEQRLPAAKQLGETSLMFLVHPTLTKKEIDLTCSVIHEVINYCS